MKKIGSFQLGLSFAGCFLGAGYVSGQELWQFFGKFGVQGFWGVILAAALLSVIGLIMIFLVRRTGITEVDRVIIYFNCPPLRWAVILLEAAFLIGVCVIMTAGVAALCNALLGIPGWLAAAAFVLLILMIAFFGLNGMVSAFSATVPILAAFTVLFAILFVRKNGFSLSAVTPAEHTNPLLTFWPVSALVFASYNVFGSIAIIAPLGSMAKGKASVFGGIAVGALVLLLIAFSVLISVMGSGTGSEELPMLTMALSFGRPMGLIYGFLLFLAMFGTALSCLVTFVRTFSEKYQWISGHNTLFHLLCAGFIFIGSLAGFGDLIGVVYPIFGYCSILFLVFMVIHYVKTGK